MPDNEPHFYSISKVQFFIAQYPFYRPFIPILFSFWREDFTLCKFLYDTNNTLTVEIQIKYQLNILSCFFIDNQMTFLIMLISITFSIIKFGSSSRSTVFNSHSDIFTSGLIFSLCNGLNYRHHQVTVSIGCV